MPNYFYSLDRHFTSLLKILLSFNLCLYGADWLIPATVNSEPSIENVRGSLWGYVRLILFLTLLAWL